MARTIHIVGAGLAGLAAAVKLARSDAKVVVHEATAYPGGRCRSYFDRAIGMTIDNGNHLVLSGNHAVRKFAESIGSDGALVGPQTADFPFADLKSGERWTLRISDGRLPWWIVDKTRRVPGTSPFDYLGLAKLLHVADGATVADEIGCSGPHYDRLLGPVLLAALNIDPKEGAAVLASAVMRETLALGGGACRPLIAREGLSHAFIEPALAHIKSEGIEVRLEHELRALRFDGGSVAQLDFGADTIDLARRDAVILAVPTHAAASLVPGLTVPQGYRAIANAHFKIDVPAGVPPMQGLINATTEWIFAFEGRLSVTISSADRLMNVPREELAETIWNEVAKATGLEKAGIAPPMPPWQIVRERRATFAATPAENAKRPGACTRWENLFLAGDWTATGLPATLEGATRSGKRAAELVTEAG
jgi:squalene-associated FAD-dependent desaturase